MRGPHVPDYPTREPEGSRGLAARLSGRKALIVAGGRQRSRFAVATSILAVEGRIPVLADVQCRSPSPATIDTASLLAEAGNLDQFHPNVVLRIGPVPTPKALSRWLEGARSEQLFVGDGSWRDPLGCATSAYRADPATALIGLAGNVDPAPTECFATCQAADAVASATVARALDDEPFPSPSMASLRSASAFRWVQQASKRFNDARTGDGGWAPSERIAAAGVVGEPPFLVTPCW